MLLIHGKTVFNEKRFLLKTGSKIFQHLFSFNHWFLDFSATFLLSTDGFKIFQQLFCFQPLGCFNHWKTVFHKKCFLFTSGFKIFNNFFAFNRWV